MAKHLVTKQKTETLSDRYHQCWNTSWFSCKNIFFFLKNYHWIYWFIDGKKVLVQFFFFQTVTQVQMVNSSATSGCRARWESPPTSSPSRWKDNDGEQANVLHWQAWGTKNSACAGAASDSVDAFSMTVFCNIKAKFLKCWQSTMAISRCFHWMMWSCNSFLWWGWRCKTFCDQSALQCCFTSRPVMCKCRDTFAKNCTSNGYVSKTTTSLKTFSPNLRGFPKLSCLHEHLCVAIFWFQF